MATWWCRAIWNLSGYRYASLKSTAKTESGSLTLRAGGDLNIYGSINDGFAAPTGHRPMTMAGCCAPVSDYTGGTVVVPGSGVTLEVGTVFPAGGCA